MDPPREGGSSTRPPWFDGTNYAYWKVRMRAHLISLNVNVWLAIEKGWLKPTHVVDTVTIEKPMETWSRAEQEKAEWNYKALSAIFCAVSADEFRRISSCEIAKEAWKILELTHEGNSTVKKSKLQKITSEFERLKMSEDDMFDSFYAKLCDIVNSSFNLGEPIPNSKIVRKILRSLPFTFQAKVTAIEEARDVDAMRVEDLVGSLQTYEANMIKPRSRGVALKSVKEEKSSSSDDDVIPSPEEIAVYTKKIRKFFKEKDGKLRRSKKNEKVKAERPSEKKKENKSKGVKCYECQGYGHIAYDCGNKKGKKKVLNATLDDTDESSTSSSSEDLPENYTAFMVRASASINTEESSSSKGKKEESSESEDEEKSDEEVDVEEAYELLYQDCRKLHKQNEKLTVKNKMLKRERDSLKVALEELQRKLESLEESKKSQENLITTFKTKLEQKDKELKDAQSKLQSMQSKKNSATANLDDILGRQRSPNDKRGLGYTGKQEVKVETKATSSKKKNPLPVKQPYIPRKQASKKGQRQNVYQRPQGKFQGTQFQAYFKFVPTCHHCGIKGHIRPNCHKLYGLPLSYVDTRNFMRPNFQVSNRFAPLRFQESYYDSRPYMPRPMRKNKKKNFSKPIGPKPIKPTKTRTIWVRKSDLYFTHTPKDVEGVSLDM